jgi:hypothetical protein
MLMSKYFLLLFLFKKVERAKIKFLFNFRDICKNNFWKEKCFSYKFGMKEI